MFLFEPFDEKFENAIYLSGIALMGLMILFSVISIYTGFRLPACIFLSRFGVPCPACGGTRAFICMLSGNFAKSLSYNPSVMYAGIIWIIFFTSKTSCILLKRKAIFLMRPIYIIGFPMIMLISWFIRLATI